MAVPHGSTPPRTVFADAVGAVPLGVLAAQLDGRVARRAMFEAAVLAYEARHKRRAPSAEAPDVADARTRARLGAAMAGAETYAAFQTSLPEVAACMSDVAMRAMAPGLFPRADTAPSAPPPPRSGGGAPDADPLAYGGRILSADEAVALSAFADFEVMRAALEEGAREEDGGGSSDGDVDLEARGAAALLVGLNRAAMVAGGELMDVGAAVEVPLAAGTPAGRLRASAGPGAAMTLVDNYLAMSDDDDEERGGAGGWRGEGDGGGGASVRGGQWGEAGASVVAAGEGCTATTNLRWGGGAGEDDVVPFAE